MLSDITIDKNALAEFGQGHFIRKLAFFGSVLREDFTGESDVDVLVEFEVGHVPGFLGLAGMESELSELVGRKADMRTPGDLSRHFRDEVVSEAVVQYVT